MNQRAERFVLPLDAASHRVGVGLGNGFAGEHRFNRISKVRRCHLVGLLPVVIDPALVNKLPPMIEHEDVRGADGAVGLRHLLRFVAKIRKRKILFLRADFHLVKTVFGKMQVVVRINGEKFDILGKEFIGERDEAVFVGLRVRAMIAGEADDNRLAALEGFKVVNHAVGPRQSLKIRPDRAHLQGFGTALGDQDHVFSMWEKLSFVKVDPTLSTGPIRMHIIFHNYHT